MKTSLSLNKLAVAISLLAGTNAAMALTPYTGSTPNTTLPEITVVVSGGAAQDAATLQAVKYLAKPGTLDIFQDTATKGGIVTNGGNFTAYYFTGSNNLTDVAARNKRILFLKRSLGAAGYGVVPLIQNSNLDQLQILGTVAADWSADTNPLDPADLVSITHVASKSKITGNPGKYLQQVKSHGGLIGVDAPALLQPATNNYPAKFVEWSTNAPTSPWNTTLTPASLATAGLTRIPTGGEVYGIAVTTDFYKVLQAAQIASGSLTLPSGHVLGAYTSDGDLPSLSKTFVASLLAGTVPDWGNVSVNVVKTSVDPATPAGAYGLTPGLHTLPEVATAAGIATPTGGTTAAIALRNNGAAVGALHYAKFLGYPYVANGPAPAVAIANDATLEANAAPLIKAPTGTSDTDNLLNDWQTGSNVTSENNVAGAKYWGLAIQTADRNVGGSTFGYRYIKIDGAAPTIANAANGSYDIWGEGEVLIHPSASSTVKTFLTDFAKQLGDTSLANAIDDAFTQPFGVAGIFGTPVTTGTAVTAPTSSTNQAIPFTTSIGANTSIGIVPYLYDPTGNLNPTILIK